METQEKPCIAATVPTEENFPTGGMLPDEMEDELSEDTSEGDGTLYEHFRVVADRGQQLMRIDKFLLDH